MCDASKALADDYAEAMATYPALATAADALCDCHHTAMSEQMQVLGQMLHRKVFKPVQREVD